MIIIGSPNDRPKSYAARKKGQNTYRAEGPRGSGALMPGIIIGSPQIDPIRTHQETRNGNLTYTMGQMPVGPRVPEALGPWCQVLLLLL